MIVCYATDSGHVVINIISVPSMLVARTGFSALSSLEGRYLKDTSLPRVSFEQLRWGIEGPSVLCPLSLMLLGDD